MKKIMALVQVVLITLIVAYGTYHLFKGNFEVSFATLPLLMCYYVFVVARHNRRSQPEQEEERPEDSQ